jgi:hypothetical protein
VAYTFNIKLDTPKHEELYVIKEIAKEDSESCRVVGLSGGGAVFIFGGGGFGQVGVLAKS